MSETQKSITQWANQTFGPAPDLSRIAARANEEMAELLRHTTANQPASEIAEEAADVVIVLYRLVENCGFDLQEQIDRKMAINRAREWNLDTTGHGYHKRNKASQIEREEKP